MEVLVFEETVDDRKLNRWLDETRAVLRPAVRAFLNMGCTDSQLHLYAAGDGIPVPEGRKVVVTFTIEEEDWDG